MTAAREKLPISWPLVLCLVVLIHADWHFARPLHHRLSLDWSSHWIACAVIFGVAGWIIVSRWPERRWSAAVWIVGLAIVGGQILEPLLEAAYYEHRLGYDVEPARWVAFWQCLGAGLPVIALMLLLLRAGRTTDAQGG